MTPVNSAAKMVSHLRRWLTGEEVTTESSCSVENVSGRCGTCTCNLVASSQLHYRGRSYSDCCTTLCHREHLDVDARERSYSVSSRRMTSEGWRKLRLRTHHTSSGSTWSSSQQSDVRAILEEDRELCHCCEPVCCCERCFVYVDDRPPLLPPPYSELLIGHCADVMTKSVDNEPSVTVNAADVTDQVTVVSEAGENRTSLPTETCLPDIGQLSDTVSAVFLI